MKYRNSIIGLGFVIIIMQILGFSESWRSGLAVLTGLGIIALAYFAGKEKMAVQDASASANRDIPPEQL